MKKIVVANRKGGIGKTTFGRHLVWFGAERGCKVLAVDFDNVQANFSKTWRIVENENGFARPDDALTAVGIFEPGNVATPAQCTENIFYVPTDAGILEVERGELGAVIDVAKSRFDALSSGYDLCIIDTGPSVTNLLIAALAVCDFAVAPCKPDRDAIDGLEEFFVNVRQVRDEARINPKLAPLWVLPNQVDRARAYHRDVLTAMRDAYGAHVLPHALYERAAIDIAKDRPVWRTARGEGTSAAAKEMRQACEQVFNLMGL